MKVAVVLGTRPEIVKMSPVIRALDRRGVEHDVIHTGQHYSREMDAVFFETLALAPPAFNLEVGSGSHGAQTGRILAGVEEALRASSPDVVLVQGDTNTVVAGALAASKLGIRVGHVEAGLRSFDRSMPEEINRVVADHVADLLFAPTAACAATLAREGIPATRVHVTGNTVVDAVFAHRDLAAARSTVLAELGVAPGGYLLLTAHRQENVDDARRFAGILAGAAAAGEALGAPVLYPIHPRSRKMLARHGLDARSVRLVDPLDFLGFLALESRARLVLTDSGGVQEEACVLGVPCVTLRDNTERPETIDVGANRLSGVDPASIQRAVLEADAALRAWTNPFGDGRAGERIVDLALASPPSRAPGLGGRASA
ncbi:MAG TPA: UDP-N-acetylglucosamine 2-epimerase (non-hydrolyzing) [Candidatus Thermoplasmatota archaeon]|nr:UDP-N-acetylglucosamine 2-epimerase (non-hydrolyzing) [Candidatus Thermoplasmatota archaeon]